MKNSILATFTLCLFAAVGIGCAQNPKQGKQSVVVDSSSQFADRIVASEIPVVVDFWAAWCMPCRWLDPIIDELEKEYKGRVLFMKVDIDIHRAMSAHFKVNSIPYVFVIEDKTVRTALPGVRDKKTYKDAIEEAIKLAAARKSAPKPDDKGQCTVNC